MDTAAYLRLFERMAGTRGMADAALAAMGLEDARRNTAAPFDAGPAQAAFHRAEIVRAPEVFLHRRTAGRAGRGRMQAYSGMDGRRAVHRPVLHRGHGFHAHGLSAAGRAPPFGRERIGRLEAAEESAAQGTAVEKIRPKPGDIAAVQSLGHRLAESASGRTALSVRGEEHACALTLEELSVRLERCGFFAATAPYLVNMQKVGRWCAWTRNSYALLRLENGRNPVCRSWGRIDAMRRQYRF